MALTDHFFLADVDLSPAEIAELFNRFGRNGTLGTVNN